MIGIKAVAKCAGVSISTVSNVINNTKYVSPELREKVEQAIKQLSYEPNPVARSMKSNKTGTIGVITKNICGMFYPHIIKGIYSVANANGNQIMLCDNHGDFNEPSCKSEFEIIKGLVHTRVDGIIFISNVSAEYEAEYIEKIKKLINSSKPVPLVSIERDFTNYSIDSVVFSAVLGAQTAAGHLIKCGCQNICCIFGKDPIQKDFISGFKTAAAKASLPLNESLQFCCTDFSFQGGFQAMQKIHNCFPQVDGIFAANDEMAAGAMKYLKENGIGIPDEVKIIGYGDEFVSSIMEPPLSSIHVDKQEIGIQAAKLLLARIDNEQSDERAIRITLDPKLVIRNSTIATSTIASG